MEIERYILWLQVGISWHTLNRRSSPVLYSASSRRVSAGSGIRRTGIVFRVALAPKPALEPHPLRRDHITGRYLPYLRPAFRAREEFIDLLLKFQLIADRPD